MRLIKIALLFTGSLVYAQANQDLSNLTSPTAINQDFIFDTGADVVVKTKDESGATKAFSFITGDSSTDMSGTVTISSGAAALNNSGVVKITTGSVLNSSMVTGHTLIYTGDATGTSGSGDVIVSSGAVEDGSSGSVIIQSGYPSGSGLRGLIGLDAPIITLNGNALSGVSKIYSSGVAAPTLGACGTSPSIAGTDSVGRITVGTGGVATSCTVTFNQAWSSTPVCIANSQSGAIALQVVPTTTTLTISASAAFGALSVLAYQCIGFQ